MPRTRFDKFKSERDRSSSEEEEVDRDEAFAEERAAFDPLYHMEGRKEEESPMLIDWGEFRQQMEPGVLSVADTTTGRTLSELHGNEPKAKGGKKKKKKKPEPAVVEEDWGDFHWEGSWQEDGKTEEVALGSGSNSLTGNASSDAEVKAELDARLPVKGIDPGIREALLRGGVLAKGDCVTNDEIKAEMKKGQRDRSGYSYGYGDKESLTEFLKLGSRAFATSESTRCNGLLKFNMLETFEDLIRAADEGRAEGFLSQEIVESIRSYVKRVKPSGTPNHENYEQFVRKLHVVEVTSSRNPGKKYKFTNFETELTGTTTHGGDTELRALVDAMMDAHQEAVCQMGKFFSDLDCLLLNFDQESRADKGPGGGRRCSVSKIMTGTSDAFWIVLELETWFEGDLAAQKPGLNGIDPFLDQLERHKTRCALVGFGISADGTKMNPMSKRRPDQLLDVPMLDMGVVGGELRFYNELRQSGLQGGALALDGKCPQKGIYSRHRLLSDTKYPYTTDGVKMGDWMSHTDALRLVQDFWVYLAVDTQRGTMDAYGLLLYRAICEVQLEEPGMVARFMQIILDLYANISPGSNRLQNLDCKYNNIMTDIVELDEDRVYQSSRAEPKASDGAAVRRMRTFKTMNCSLVTHSLKQLLEWKGECQVIVCTLSGMLTRIYSIFVLRGKKYKN